MRIKAGHWRALTKEERSKLIKWAAEGNQLKYWVQ